MKVSDLIRGFCDKNADKYYLYENYSGRFMYGAKCLGVVIRSGYSPMSFMFELTRFLDEYADDVDGTLFEGIAYDSLGLDVIVYFPRLSDDE